MPCLALGQKTLGPNHALVGGSVVAFAKRRDEGGFYCLGMLFVRESEESRRRSLLQDHRPCLPTPVLDYNRTQA